MHSAYQVGCILAQCSREVNSVQRACHLTCVWLAISLACALQQGAPFVSQSKQTARKICWHLDLPWGSPCFAPSWVYCRAKGISPSPVLSGFGKIVLECWRLAHSKYICQMHTMCLTAREVVLHDMEDRPGMSCVLFLNVVSCRLTIGGSLIGGIKETQEMLDFCGEKGIVCDVEKVDIDYVNTAMDRLAKNDVHYRFSIDIQGSLIDE